MSVSTVNSTLPQYEEESLYPTVGKRELDQYDFMNLLITQLQYQDPMKPMDTYEMASQLSQFSNMQATLEMSDNMEKLLNYQTSQNNLQLLTLLDNQVQIIGNTMGVNEGVPGGGEYTLPEDADTCVVEIYDAGGHLVQMVDAGALSSGTHPLEWDGKDALGETVDDGAYTYWVKAYNALGEQLDVDYRVSGMVTGVTFDSGTAQLKLDNCVGADVGSVVSVL
ncbi:MAG: flagellar hook assembly protein FlgD [Desulfobulbaceae bacterium]|nr:flagellar hook assembly protein FlgD [Pseudomonadota bacterium]MCG2746720.1 flagellar hook assembly protein FlgD [Desulfobulbaceae bacterium]